MASMHSAVGMEQLLQQIPNLPAGSSPDDNENGKRKKNSDGGPPEKRTKRNRYISQACNECKRRKIKCNGENPCQRCGTLAKECIYEANCCGNGFKDSNEWKIQQQRIDMLEHHVASLTDNINALRRALGQEFEPVEMYQPAAMHQHHQGHDMQHQAHGMDLQNQGLDHSGQTMNHQSQGLDAHSQAPQASMSHANSVPLTRGFSGQAYAFNDEVGLAQDGLASLEAHQQAEGGENDSPRIDPAILHDEKDPIWALNKEESLRFVRMYQDEIGIMYPIVNFDKLTAKTSTLFDFIDSLKKSGMFRQGLPGKDAMHDVDTNIVKLVLANAMLTKGHGQSELAKKLFASVMESGEEHGTEDLSNLKAIKIVTLKAMFRFLSDDEVLAWREIGHAARLILELGLNRAETYAMFADEDIKTEANLLFWSVYVLDRRWSFGTGLQFALQEDAIDTQLVKPTEASPYLAAMISLTDIGSKVWKAVAKFKKAAGDKQSASREQMQFLDFQLTKWYQGLPKTLQYDITSTQPVADRATHRLQLLLYLRRNQMQIMIYRPVLHAANLAPFMTEAQTVVNIAKDSIRHLSQINQTSDIYRSQQMTFNHFLVAALGVLFLAAANAPEQFAESCRAEFYQALELVRGLSADSYVSKRLWSTIKGIRDVAPKMGLADIDSATGEVNPVQEQYQQHDAHSSAAMGLAGLAGHPVDGSMFFAGQYAGQGQLEGDTATDLTTSPNGMANELVNLYESGDFNVGMSWGSEGQVGDLMMEMF